MNDKKNIVALLLIVIVIVFFVFVANQAIAYWSKTASITTEEQNMAVEIATVGLAQELSSIPTYKVYVPAVGRYEKNTNQKIKIIDVFYFFENKEVKASVDITNRFLRQVVWTETMEETGG